MIARANRADTEASAPLLAYYHSFADAGEPVPPIAIDGLTKALSAVPNAPTTRVTLGTELSLVGRVSLARSTLMPVARGGYESPERASAIALLATLPRPEPIAGNH